MRSYRNFLIAFHQALGSTGCKGGEWEHIHIYPPDKSWQYDGYACNLRVFPTIHTQAQPLNTSCSEWVRTVVLPAESGKAKNGGIVGLGPLGFGRP